MALQTSGPISISNIKAELGSTSNSLRALSAAAGKSTPDAMSEFYGFTAYTPPSLGNWGNTQSGAGTQANPYIITKNNFSFYENDEPIGGCGDYVADIQFYARNRIVEHFSSTAFTNQHSGAQRVHATMTNINFSNASCAYYPPFYALAYFNMYGSGISLNRSTQFLNELKTEVTNITADFTSFVGNNIAIAMGALNPHREVGFQCYYHPDESFMFYDVTVCDNPPPAISSCTLSIWFQKL